MSANAPENKSLKRDRISTVTLTVLCQSFQALSVGGIALLLPLIRQDLGLNFTQGGSLAAATTLFYALMQIPAGHLSDRFSPRRLFVIGVLGASTLALTFALVTTYWQALANQMLSGFFRALLFTPGMALLTGWFPPNRRATAMGLYLVGGHTGNVIFNLGGPFLVNLYGWRVGFISFASIGIISALLLWKIGKEPAYLVARRKSRISEVFELFKYRIMWVCASIQFVRYSIMQGIGYWLPSLLVNEKGLSLQFTGTIIAIQAVLIAPSNVIGGYISDRLKNPNLVIGVSLVVLAITSTLIVLVNDIPLLIAIIAINAIFVQMYFGPLFSIPVEILGIQKAGISSGFSNMFANFGGLVAAYSLGVLKDLTGAFASGFHLIAGLAVAGVMLNFVLAKMRSRALSQMHSHDVPMYK